MPGRSLLKPCCCPLVYVQHWSCYMCFYYKGGTYRTPLGVTEWLEYHGQLGGALCAHCCLGRKNLSQISSVMEKFHFLKKQISQTTTEH